MNKKWKQKGWISVEKLSLTLKKIRLSIRATLAKVSDRNSFWANQNYSDSFQYLYRSQCKSFRINPKNVLYFVWWRTVKNRSDLIRFNLRQQSEWIRTNPIWDSFGLILIENSVWINPSSDWFGLKTWFRISSDSCILLPRIKSD